MTTNQFSWPTKEDYETAKCLNVSTVQPVAFMTTDKRMLVFADKVGDDRGMLPLYSKTEITSFKFKRFIETGG